MGVFGQGSGGMLGAPQQGQGLGGGFNLNHLLALLHLFSQGMGQQGGTPGVNAQPPMTPVSGGTATTQPGLMSNPMNIGDIMSQLFPTPGRPGALTPNGAVNPNGPPMTPVTGAAPTPAVPGNPFIAGASGMTGGMGGLNFHGIGANNGLNSGL